MAGQAGWCLGGSGQIAELKTLDDRATIAAGDLLRSVGLKAHLKPRGSLFGARSGAIRAVDGVDLNIAAGETLGLVGESGCGKSTLGRTLIGLVPATQGEIWFDGRRTSELTPRAMRAVRKDMQMIFQDPVSSLNPRMTIRRLVGEGLDIHGLGTRQERGERVREMLERVGLNHEVAERYPHQFSGGQRQRIGIARALVLGPKFVVADEPVSALDVSVQSQILNLLVDLKTELGLTYLFISHNLAVVGYIADRIAVMYLGRIVETGSADDILERPEHPYTVALLSSMLEVETSKRRPRIVLRGDVPSPHSIPSGCRFRTRCPIAKQICTEVDPSLDSAGARHQVACHFPGQFTG